MTIRFLTILDRMNYQAERMLKLIDGLLDLRRIEDGRLSLEFNRFDVAKLVKGTIDEWRLRSSDHEFTVASPDSMMIFADRQRIEDVLSNLLDNAVKYSPSMSDIHTEIRSLIESDEPMVEVSVIDRGTGLEPEESEHIFERFYQGRKVLHKGHSGLGLGLYFSKQIVERHGGTLIVEETPGGGCTFRFNPRAGPCRRLASRFGDAPHYLISSLQEWSFQVREVVVLTVVMRYRAILMLRTAFAYVGQRAINKGQHVLRGVHVERAPFVPTCYVDWAGMCEDASRP